MRVTKGVDETWLYKVHLAKVPMGISIFYTWNIIYYRKI